MSDPLFTPLKSHPSTWQQEVAQIKDKLAEAESAVEWADVRATQAVEEARELRVKNERLIEERDQALAGSRGYWQASRDNAVLRERVAKLEAALLWYEPLLTDFSQETNHRADCAEELLDRDGGKRARVALRDGKG